MFPITYESGESKPSHNCYLLSILCSLFYYTPKFSTVKPRVLILFEPFVNFGVEYNTIILSIIPNPSFLTKKSCPFRNSSCLSVEIATG